LLSGSRRHRAKIQSSHQGAGYTHLDLENLVVSLLAPGEQAWPHNVLARLGYRLHLWDTPLDLVRGPRSVSKRPDAIATRGSANVMLVIECKAGSEVGLSQLPEGQTVAPDEWAAAAGIPPTGFGTPTVVGLLIAESEALEPKLPEIEAGGLTWLRIEKNRLRVDPCRLPDDRVAPAIAAIDDLNWPRAFVPFSHDPPEGQKARALQAISPLILQAAAEGIDFVTAHDLVSKTHAAVWSCTTSDRQKSWSKVVGLALDDLAHGALKGQVTYESSVLRLRLQAVRSGQPAGERVMAELNKGLKAQLRRRQSARARVGGSAAKPLQTSLWEDDFL